MKRYRRMIIEYPLRTMDARNTAEMWRRAYSGDV
jgi:hypothetical protein